MLIALSRQRETPMKAAWRRRKDKDRKRKTRAEKKKQKQDLAALRRVLGLLPQAWTLV
jgi:hypothetical protein